MSAGRPGGQDLRGGRPAGGDFWTPADEPLPDAGGPSRNSPGSRLSGQPQAVVAPRSAPPWQPDADTGTSPASGADADYEWIRYLGGGRPIPGALPPPRPASADGLAPETRPAEGGSRWPGRRKQQQSGEKHPAQAAAALRPVARIAQASETESAASASPATRSRSDRQREARERREQEARERVQADQERREREAQKLALAERQHSQAERRREAPAGRQREAGARRRPKAASGATATAVITADAGLTPVEKTGGAARQPAVSRSPRSSRRGRRHAIRKLRWLLAGIAAAVAAVVVVVVFLRPEPAGGTRHTLVTPVAVGAWAQAPTLARQMKAEQLKSSIVSDSSGEAAHVVDAVYEQVAGPAASSGPQIVLFIGGNLSGTSASSFISSFIGKLPGALAASPGSLGGKAACVPSQGGRLAECAWADNDTFGVLASPTLGAAALATQLRKLRPAVERPVKQPDR